MPKLSNLKMQVLLQDIYMTVYEINDQLNSRSPMSSVALHECEKLDNDSFLNSILTEYIDYNIHEYFHLSLTEYMDHPEYIRKTLNKISQGKMEEKEKMMKQIETNFNTDKAK